MKIGLLAYHSAINFGATLQLLSTYSYLKNHGHEPIVINWVASDLKESYTLHSPKEQQNAQERLRKDIWRETAPCTSAQDVAKVITEEHIQAVIIGSDAVCQHHTKMERLIFPCKKIFAIEAATSDRLFPNPFWGIWNDYLSSPVPVCVLSASSQDSQYKYFTKKLCQKMTTYIKQYAYVSVRDSWTQDMFSFVTRGTITPQITPDPVFAFNNNASAFIPSKEDILKRFNLPESYILMSFINGNVVIQQWIDEFQSLANKDGIMCINLPFSQKAGFGQMQKEIPLPLSPIDWFALIKYSSGYVGNNMHPIVVSIHNSVPFFCFDNYGLKKFNGIITTDTSSKIKHILEVAGLSDYRISCISRLFKAPDASKTYNKLRGFDRSKSTEFNELYHKRYEEMMTTILERIGATSSN